LWEFSSEFDGDTEIPFVMESPPKRALLEASIQQANRDTLKLYGTPHPRVAKGIDPTTFDAECCIIDKISQLIEPVSHWTNPKPHHWDARV
jgi:hypothetical protein